LTSIQAAIKAASWRLAKSFVARACSAEYQLWRSCRSPATRRLRNASTSSNKAPPTSMQLPKSAQPISRARRTAASNLAPEDAQSCMFTSVLPSIGSAELRREQQDGDQSMTHMYGTGYSPGPCGMCDMCRCYDIHDEDAIDEHMQSKEAGLSWHVHRRCLLAKQEFSNLIRLVRGMNLGQWRQPLLQARVDRTYMVQWVPTPNRPLPLCSALAVVLLETLGNDAPLTPSNSRHSLRYRVLYSPCARTLS
jgi:hypothetical protein